MKFTAREKAILCGLYLAREDRAGLRMLGFESFREAYNVLGLSLGVSAGSVRLYRDEFDSIFPHRKGWHKRAMKPQSQKVFERCKDFSAAEIFSLILSFTGRAGDIESHAETTGAESYAETGDTESHADTGDTESHAKTVDAESHAKTNATQTHSTFAKRILTGRAAENFFAKNYAHEPAFAGRTAVDMTHAGCGYDFRLHHPNRGHFAVEVKGIAAQTGGIILTANEFHAASTLRENYFLYIVRNVSETPAAETIRNPAHAGLQFKRTQRTVTQTSWKLQV